MTTPRGGVKRGAAAGRTRAAQARTDGTERQPGLLQAGLPMGASSSATPDTACYTGNPRDRNHPRSIAEREAWRRAAGDATLFRKYLCGVVEEFARIRVREADLESLDLSVWVGVAAAIGGSVHDRGVA